MVMYAALETNIRTLMPDAVDRSHGIRYDPGSVCLTRYGKHTFSPGTGFLWLCDIQNPERPVVKSLAGSGTFQASVYVPVTIPASD